MLRPRRAGFSLFEAIIATGILAIIGAAILPSIAGNQQQRLTSQTADELLAIGAAVQKFELAANVGTYPGKLSDLTTEITVGDPTSCPTRTYTAEAATVAKWRVGGPYLDRVVPTTGLQLSLGVANNALTRSSGVNLVGSLLVTIPNVDYSDALRLNDVMDGPGDVVTVGLLNLKGAIRWTTAPGASGTVSVLFAMPVGARC